MPLLYYLNVTLHVLAALTWLGGMFFLGLVGAPVLRAVEPASLRQALFHQLGLRFRTVGWACLAVLLATGLVNLSYRGWLHWTGVWDSPDFWRTPVGIALGTKVVMVLAMAGLAALHDFVIGPAAGRAPTGSPEALALRARAAWMGRLNAVLGVVLLVAAIRLTRG